MIHEGIYFVSQVQVDFITGFNCGK